MAHTAGRVKASPDVSAKPERAGREWLISLDDFRNWLIHVA